jgi:hypothetical protein
MYHKTFYNRNYFFAGISEIGFLANPVPLKWTDWDFQMFSAPFFLIVLKNTITVQVMVIPVRLMELTGSKQKSTVYIIKLL